MPMSDTDDWSDEMERAAGSLPAWFVPRSGVSPPLAAKKPRRRDHRHRPLLIGNLAGLMLRAAANPSRTEVGFDRCRSRCIRLKAT